MISSMQTFSLEIEVKRDESLVPRGLIMRFSLRGLDSMLFTEVYGRASQLHSFMSSACNDIKMFTIHIGI